MLMSLTKSGDTGIDFRFHLRRTPANCLQGQASPPDGVAGKCEIATAYVPVIGEPGNQEAGKQIIRKSEKWCAEHTLPKWIPASAGMTVGIGQFE